MSLLPLTDEEQYVARRAVERYREANREKRERLLAAADRFGQAALDLEQVWSECRDYTGDAFENYPANWPSFDELASAAAGLTVRAGDRYRAPDGVVYTLEEDDR